MKLARLDDGPEIFHTLQGEGISAGVPAVFVRASRCNLHCRWCDTDYTWNFEGTPWPHDLDQQPGYRKHCKAEVTIEVGAESMAEHVARFPARRVVLTGGEPLLQQSGWIELIRILRNLDPDYSFEIETNGTLAPSAGLEPLVDQFNVSPKLANSGMPEELRIQPKTLEFFASHPRTWFKFVSSSAGDLEEIDALVARFGLPAARILLMPEGRCRADLDRHGPEIAAACLERGWRFCDRLHVRLWGDRRGV